MSYTDSANRPFKPAGLAAATLINGAAILGIFFAVPQIAEIIKDPPLTADWIDTPIQPIPETIQETQPDRKDQTLTAPPQRNDQRTAESDNGATALTGSEGGDVILPPGPDPIITPPLPPIPNPVLKLARIDPRYASALQPEYPSSMIRAEMEGRVTLRVLIGADGRVKQVDVVSSASPEFAEAAKRQALRKWRFVPGTSDGTPIESWKEMTVRFEMPQ